MTQAKRERETARAARAAWQARAGFERAVALRVSDAQKTRLERAAAYFRAVFK